MSNIEVVSGRQIHVTVPQGKQGPPGTPGATGPPGPQGPQGEQGEGIAIKGTLSGTSTPYPSNPVTGDTWIIGSPVPNVAQPAAVGDGVVWSGTVWNNIGPLRGPVGPTGPVGATGPQGVQGLKGDTGNTGAIGPVSTTPGPVGPTGVTGPSGVYLNPSPPATTNVLWADTDELGYGAGPGGGTGGVNAVFAQNGPTNGLTSAPGYFWMIDFDDPFYGTSTTLPPGWAFAGGGTYIVVPAGVYSYYLSWTAPDQYWYAQIETGYQIGKPNTYVYINPGAVVYIGGTWYGACSGTVPIHNTGGYVDAPWFGFYVTHHNTATLTNACRWQFNVTRLGDLPA